MNEKAYRHTCVAVSFPTLNEVVSQIGRNPKSWRDRELVRVLADEWGYLCDLGQKDVRINAQFFSSYEALLRDNPQYIRQLKHEIRAGNYPRMRSTKYDRIVSLDDHVSTQCTSGNEEGNVAA